MGGAYIQKITKDPYWDEPGITVEGNSWRDLFKKPTEEQFLEYRQKRQMQMLRLAQIRDKQLEDFPYIDHLPLIFSAVRRQSNDHLMTNISVSLFYTYFLAHLCARMTYGPRGYCRENIMKYFKRMAIPNACLWCLFVWFRAPHCQFQNRHTNQIMFPDQVMKNYFDEKYPDIYKDADKQFYHRMMINEYRTTEAAQYVKMAEKREQKIIDHAYRKHILGEPDLTEEELGPRP